MGFNLDRTLTYLLLWSTIAMSLGAPMYFNKHLEEAEQIALESTGLLQPIDSVVRRIMKDLKSIRDEYPAIQDVVHRKKWIPGEVVVRGLLTEDQVNKIDDSRLFGPIQQVRKIRTNPDGPKVLVFSNAYNPERVAEKLYEKFGIRAEPNTEDVYGGNGFVTYNPQSGTFVIEQRPKNNAYAGFRNKSLWEFSVKNGRVELLRSVKPGFEFSG